MCHELVRKVNQVFQVSWESNKAGTCQWKSRRDKGMTAILPPLLILLSANAILREVPRARFGVLIPYLRPNIVFLLILLLLSSSGSRGLPDRTSALDTLKERRVRKEKGEIGLN